MAKYKVIQRFKGLEENQVYEEGQEIELTVKRADEIIANLSKHKGVFIERVDTPIVESKKKSKRGK